MPDRPRSGTDVLRVDFQEGQKLSWQSSGGRAGWVLAGSMAGLRTPQSMADEECLLRSRRRNAGDTDSDTRWGRDASPWPVSC